MSGSADIQVRMDEPLTDTGIDMIGEVPWGTHFCLFYKTSDGLLDILIPYFKAGLQNNEFCMWVTSEPLSRAEAEKAIRKAVPGFNRLIRSGQIEIVPHDEWSLKDGVFSLQRVLDGWIEKLEAALANGYSGLRTTGDTAWLESKDWTDFYEYEKEVDSVIGEYRMMALCTYSLDKCSATDVLDVVKNHEFALLEHEGAWELIESSEHKRAVDALWESEERYRNIVETTSEGIWMLDAESNTSFANQRMAEMLGYSMEEIQGKPLFHFMDEESKAIAEEYVERRRGGISEVHDFKFQRKDGTELWASLSTSAITSEDGSYAGALGMVTDITQRKRAEETLRDETDFIDIALNALQDGFYVLSIAEQGKLVRWNKLFNDATGYSDQELSDMTVFDFFDDEGKKMQEQLFVELLEKGKASIEVEIITKDGRRIPYHCQSTLVKDAEGNPSYVCGVARDITERKRDEEALRKSEETYHLVVETAAEGIGIIDAEGRVIFANKQIGGMLGYDIEKDLGRKWNEFIHEASTPTVGASVKSRYRGTLPDIKLRRHDGTEIWVMISTNPIFDKDNNYTGAISLFTDVTERKWAEEELKRINAELGEFAHTVSHDLRGPLTAIMGANLVLQNVLQKSEESENNQFKTDVHELLEIIDTGVNKAEALIKDILALAEAGQLPEEVSDVDVSEVVKMIIEERADDIKERGIAVKVDDDLGSVRVNPTHIYQIFANLISNAIKHNDNENPVIEVSCLGDDEESLHRYLIRDNGSGIPPEYLGRIFLPFVKGKTGETGIGLTTVEKIVAVYGGEIRAYDDDGACFEFTLKDY